MSVSLSSVYQQTESLRQIQQKFQQALKNESIFESLIENIVTQSSNLTMSESYRLVVILSKYLNNNSSIDKKYASIYIIKKLILTGYHHFYIFISVRVLNWIFSLAKFQPKKNQSERVRLYVKQISLKGNGDQVYQERYSYKLLKLIDQFLAWFSQHIPIHINAQFQFRSTFARSYQQLQPKRPIRNYQHFKANQFQIFQQNFNAHKLQNKQIIKQIGQFIMLQVRALIEQHKYKSQLLRQTVRTSDSYCIRAIVSELCLLLQDNSKLFSCIKLTENLMNIGEIQFIELTKLYIVPVLLQYLLPFSFVEGKKLSKPMFMCSFPQQKNIIQLICVWNKIGEHVKISTKFYFEALKAIQIQRKGSLLKVQQKHLSDFLMNVLDMQGVNNDKSEFVKNSEVQQQLISIINLKQNKNPKQTTRYHAQGSAINQLKQFNQSKSSRASKPFNAIQSPTYPTGFLRNQFAKNNQNIEKIQSKEYRTSEKQSLFQISQQLVTFRQIQKNSNKQIPAGRSPFKQSLKFSNVIKENKNLQQSIFVAFDCSGMSKFSQFQSPKNQNKQNDNKKTSDLLKDSLIEMSNAVKIKKQKNKSQSQSVVYFDRSQDYHSQNYKNLPKNQLKQSKKQQPSGFFSMSSAKSFPNGQYNQQSISNYRFDASNIQTSSVKSSRIQKFGKNIQQFPLSIPKPTFGFKNMQNNIKNSQRNDQLYEQKILNNLQLSASEEEYDLSKIIQRNDNQIKFKLSESSSILKDVSGANHQINQSIKFSQGSEVNYVVPLKQQKNKHEPAYSKAMQISPTFQYFLNGQTQRQQKGLERKIKKQKILNQESKKGPKKLTLTLSQKRLSSSQKKTGNIQLIKLPNQQINGNFKNQIRNNYRNSQQTDKSVKKKHIIIDQFANDKLLDLERQLGRAIEQNKKKQQELRKKQNQYKILKSKSNPYLGRKMQILKKQDEIIQILMNHKVKQQYNEKAGQYIKPIKNENNMTDYFLQNQVKSTYTSSREPYDRILIKQILGSRCLLLSNQQLQIGYNYSQIKNQASFYLTFFKVFDKINVQVIENSLILQKQVKLFLQNQPARYQLKIKRKVIGIRTLNKQPTFTQIINYNPLNGYIFPSIQIKLSDQTAQNLIFKNPIPCSIYNLAKSLDLNKQIIQQLRNKKVIRNQPIPLGEQFIRNYKDKIDKYFINNMGLVDGWILIGYSFPKEIFGNKDNQYYKFKVIKGKEIIIQYFNDPKSILAQTILSLLTGKRK